MDSLELNNGNTEEVFVVAPDFFDALDTLKTQINVQSKEEVLQYALTLLHVVSKERYESGAKLYLSYPNGGFREVKCWNNTKPSLVAIDGQIIEETSSDV